MTGSPSRNGDAPLCGGTAVSGAKWPFNDRPSCQPSTPRSSFSLASPFGVTSTARDDGERGDIELLLGGRRDVAPCLQGPCDRHAELSREVIVAASGEAQPPCVTAQRLSSDRLRRTDRREMLQRLGDVRTGQAVVAMPPFSLAGEQPTLQHLGEVGTRRLWRDLGGMGEFAGRQRPAVEQGREHDGPRRIGNQERDRCDAGIQVHGSASVAAAHITPKPRPMLRPVSKHPPEAPR
jgi:hypothetical protein